MLSYTAFLLKATFLTPGCGLTPYLTIPPPSPSPWECKMWGPSISIPVSILAPQVRQAQVSLQLTVGYWSLLNSGEKEKQKSKCVPSHRPPTPLDPKAWGQAHPSSLPVPLLAPSSPSAGEACWTASPLLHPGVRAAALHVQLWIGVQ